MEFIARFLSCIKKVYITMNMMEMFLNLKFRRNSRIKKKSVFRSYLVGLLE